MDSRIIIIYYGTFHIVLDSLESQDGFVQSLRCIWYERKSLQTHIIFNNHMKFD